MCADSKRTIKIPITTGNIKRPGTTPYQRRLFSATRPPIPQSNTIQNSRGRKPNIENVWKKFTNFMSKHQSVENHCILQPKPNNNERKMEKEINKTFI